MLNHPSTLPAKNSILPQEAARPQGSLTTFPHSILGAMGDRSSGISGPGSELVTLASARFSVVRYPERLSEILELRRVAYGAVQKSGPDTAGPEETDPRDLQAALVIAEAAGKIIASVRLTPPLSGPILHHTCQLRGAAHALPPRSEFIEGSWACIHPDHQGKGLCWHLAAHMLIAAQQFDRPYMIFGTDKGLWSYWRRCGFRKTGATYLGALSGREYWVVMAKLEEVLAGRDIAPEFARVLCPLLTANQTTGRSRFPSSPTGGRHGLHPNLPQRSKQRSGRNFPEL